MKLKLKLLLFVIALILIFPQKVKAANSNYVIYYYKYDSQGDAYWVSQPFLPPSKKLSHERIIYLMLKEFFESESYNITCEGTKLLGIAFEDGHLTINVSKEIADYGGGTYYENCLRNQIIKTGTSIEGVDKVSLLIEGKLNYLPEGTIINGAREIIE